MCLFTKLMVGQVSSLGLIRPLVRHLLHITTNAPDTDCHSGTEAAVLPPGVLAGWGWGLGMRGDASHWSRRCLSVTPMPNTESSARRPPLPAL